MGKRSNPVLYLIALLFLLFTSSIAEGALSEPVLKWQHGGCYSSWCQTGWYSSPVAVDLEGDGTTEVIAGSYSIFILNGSDGSLIREIDPDGSRIWPGIVVTDIDGDDDPEIISAHGDGYLHLFDHAGDSVWSRQPSDRELRGLSVSDLDGDGTLEVVVNSAAVSKVNTWVYEHDGTLRAGWPQLDNDSGFAYGVFNDNTAIADLDGDGMAEIVVPSDVHYICAYRPDGLQVPANPIYGNVAWGRVGVWESLVTELRGWGMCSGSPNREERYRTNFAHGAAAIGDVYGNDLALLAGDPSVMDLGMFAGDFGDPLCSFRAF